ncbi:MAG: NAD-glutamate dehydrogenase, partial [Ghiorsea sp.]|nr:NAD-glutamate dehydrogenase [Ghiorsea sp.]
MNIQLFGSEYYSVGATQLVFVAVQVEQWPPLDRIETAIGQCVIFWKDQAKEGLLQADLPTPLLHEGLMELNKTTHLYQDQFPPEQFVRDMVAREQLKKDGKTRIRLTLRHEVELQIVEVHVLTPHALPLGVMTEKLNAFALVTMEQSLIPFHHEDQPMHICRFRCEAPEQLHAEGLTRLRQGIQDVFNQFADHDALNALIILCGINIRDVTLLISLRNHLAQLIPEVSVQALSEVMLKQHKVSAQIFRMFEAKHRPSLPTTAVAQAESDFQKSMQDVQNLKEDTWLRALSAIVQASVRTNAWIREQGQALAIKVNTAAIAFAPYPKPYREIFVHGVCVEGVHLRAGKIARGGLRYSDRPTDFRTEVLGLMKAQNVKNSIIVPVGSKGGFVCKQLPSNGDRDAFMKEGIACYQNFIRSMLDLTDNIVAGKIVHPQNVIRYDKDDPYLVVAADKGTATFSDIANGISSDYGHWLGDAFASGGSIGYDHKAMGITAKGAWESVKRHFRELGIDCQSEDFSVVGIGDMMGDVFGNGMLLSKHICLKAAFNHMHIFLDPNPDSAKTWKERQRLFDLPRSSWEDYNKTLISKGGGIFSRFDKSIPLSPEVKKAFGISADEMSPQHLIRTLLKSKVDLLWNGGIGTYLKATNETDEQVGDSANNALRVNGKDLRCSVVGEGGNLGCTQLGRIEYAQRGGKINTDFIDNSAGVDCSDHEVNIKILVQQMMEAGKYNAKTRVKLLESMTDNVGELVLRNNYSQTQTLSMMEYHSRQRLGAKAHLIKVLEKRGLLDREIEFLPSNQELKKRQVEGKGLSRPELCV